MLFDRKNRNQENDVSGTSNPWSSYSDMMAALLLVFILIMFYFVYQNLDITETNQRQYEEQVAELREKESILQQKEGENTILQLQIEAQQSELDEQRIQLEAQQSTLAEQQAQLETQQEQLEKLIGVKAAIITSLTEALQEAGMQVTVDQQTGAIRLDSSILFTSGSSNLSSEGSSFLRSFLPLYIGTLLNDENREYISEIIIEGHTDTIGSYMYNLDLSQRRALSVASYCVNDRNGILPETVTEILRVILTANGRSYSNPIYDKDGNVDLEASRRVEFKFRLRDTEMIESMIEILEGNAK